MSGYKHLRVEESQPSFSEREQALANQPTVPVVIVNNDVEHWRKLAIDTGKRLEYAETQLNDLRKAADDARERFGKYKGRLDNANARVNELQAKLVRASAELEDVREQLKTETKALRSQLAKQEALARRVYEYRQSLLNGPLWELFVDLAVSQPSAGEESKA